MNNTFSMWYELSRQSVNIYTSGSGSGQRGKVTSPGRGHWVGESVSVNVLLWDKLKVESVMFGGKSLAVWKTILIGPQRGVISSPLKPEGLSGLVC